MSEREHGRHNCDCSECRKDEAKSIAEHLAESSRRNINAGIALQAEVDRLEIELDVYRRALETIARADEWSGGVWFRSVATDALKKAGR